MADVDTTRSHRTHDWANLLLGLGLFLTPWVYGYTGDRPAAMTAWLTGGVVALVAATALWRFAEWEEWVAMALGAWTVAAPFILRFQAGDLALQAFVLVGVLLMVSSIWRVWVLHHPETFQIPNRPGGAA